MRSIVMRALRLRLGFSLMDFQRATGVSHQYFSDVELGKQPAGDRTRALVYAAFESAIRARQQQAADLLDIYEKSKGRLFEPTDGEVDYEL